jgi:hypothetical protein
MYEREDILQLVKMLERGLFARGKDFVITMSFTLEDHKEGLRVACEEAGFGKSAVFIPSHST